MSDDAKKTILARRARFVAAAVASIGIACGKTTESPGPCLSVAYVPDGGEGEAPPMPSLSPMTVDAAPSAALDASVADAGADSSTSTSTTAVDAGTKVQPVPKPKPRPQVCLSAPIKLPKDKQ